MRDVSFSLADGEALGIVGANGAGKSTVLKILAGITAPSTATSRTRGRVAALLELGTGFHPELTGRENIYLNGAILGMSRLDITRRFDQIVDFSGVARFLDTPVKRYSSGMYLRLAFAVAAHLEPAVLVVDEILAVGDAEFQRKCIVRMQEAEEEGRLVFVSHDLETLIKLCERSIWLESGQIRDSGRTDVIVRYTPGLWFGTQYEELLDLATATPFTLHGSHLDRPERILAMALPFQVDRVNFAAGLTERRSGVEGGAYLTARTVTSMGNCGSRVSSSLRRSSGAASPSRNAMLVSTFPWLDTSTWSAPKASLNSRWAESGVNAQYHVSAHRSVLSGLMPGNVASTTPPALRIRRRV